MIFLGLSSKKMENAISVNFMIFGMKFMGPGEKNTFMNTSWIG
jgi:hypothetical protein